MVAAGGEGPVSPLIGVSELADLLAGTSAPVVLDVRWTLAGSDRPGYLAGHIPTGVFVDLDAELAGQPGSGGRHPLPDPDALQRFWRSCGIDAGSTVVAYDDADASAAARAWWLLRWSGIHGARVLDGGLSAWRAAGFALVPGAETATAEGGVVVRPGGMPTVEADDLLGDLAERVVLLDARAARRYRGEVEPIDPVAGHIPGAVNLPYLHLLDDQRRFRPATEVAAAFAEAGIGPGTMAAASCGSGVTACLLILAAACVGSGPCAVPGLLLPVVRPRAPRRHRRLSANVDDPDAPFERAEGAVALPRQAGPRYASTSWRSRWWCGTRQMLRYDLGGSHPLHPLRWELTWKLAAALGVLDGIELTSPQAASDDELAGSTPATTSPRSGAAPARKRPTGTSGHGIGTSDNPAFPGMHEASALIAGGSVAGGQGHRRGRGPPGGQHRRRAAPRDGRPGVRVLRLQRSGPCHRGAAGGRCRAGRVRRRRRAPRGRSAGGVLRRSPGAHRLACTRRRWRCGPGPDFPPSAGAERPSAPR